MAVATQTLTYRDAIREAMRVEMERDPTVVIMGEDVAGGASLPGFENEDAWGGYGRDKGLVKQFGRVVLDSRLRAGSSRTRRKRPTGLPHGERHVRRFLRRLLRPVFNQGAELPTFRRKAKVPLVVRRCSVAAFLSAARVGCTTGFTICRAERSWLPSPRPTPRVC